VKPYSQLDISNTSHSGNRVLGRSPL